MEKLKETFKKERVDWDIEKAALAKRAEDAEAALKPVVEELTGLKRQINAMTSAVFGKYPHLMFFNSFCLTRYRFTDACNVTGTRITHLGSDMRMKLKAAYTLIEQLYSEAQRAISTAAHNEPPPTLIKETFEKLLMLPARLDELKRSAARSGAPTALIQAKPWIPDLESSDIGRGYPGVKEDGSVFSNDDLRWLTRKMHPLASKLAEETNLSHYQPIYDCDQKRYPAPTHDVEDLIPPIYKHTYAPDVDPSNLISDEAVFQALTGIDWATIDFQPLGREEEDAPAQDDPQPSTQPGDES